MITGYMKIIQQSAEKILPGGEIITTKVVM